DPHQPLVVRSIAGLHWPLSFFTQVVHIGVAGSEALHISRESASPVDTTLRQARILPARHYIQAVLIAPQREGGFVGRHAAGPTVEMLQNDVGLRGGAGFAIGNDGAERFVGEFAQESTLEVI